MRLEMLNDGQAVRVIKGAVLEHIHQHGPITKNALGRLAHDIFASIAGAMLQMAQNDVPIDHIQVEELKELREKGTKHKRTINYWMQRARNAEAELVKNNLPVPEPPQVKPEASEPGAGDQA